MGDFEKPVMTVLDGTATAESTAPEKAVTGPYKPAHELQPLQARHLFRFATILKKVGVQRFRTIFDSEAVIEAVKDGKSAEDVGVQVVFDAIGILVDNLDKIEGDLYGLLADLAGMTADEVAALPLGEFAEMLVDVVKADGFRDFFTQAQRLLR